MAKKSIRSRNTSLNGNNPFHMLILLVTALYQLLIIFVSWTYQLLILLFKHWGAALIIAAALLITLFTLGVL